MIVFYMFLLPTPSGVDSSLETLMTCMGHYEIKPSIEM